MTTLNQPAAAAPAKALLGTKLGMTQIWTRTASCVPSLSCVLTPTS